MPELITITPKPGTRKFRTVSNMQQFNQISGSTDPNEVQSTGEFKGQRFPNSRQIFKPVWSITKRRWMLAGAEYNSASLNTIVAKCKLKYEPGDPRYPGYITECDITDFDDPFFKHTKLKVIAREGEFVLDKEVSKDKILIMAIQANHQFSLKGIAGGATSNRVKYLISDKGIDRQAKKHARGRKVESITYYNNLSALEKTKIAMGMGLIIRDDSDPETVDDLLWEAANNDTGRTAQGITPQEYFIAMCEADQEEVNVRFLIQKARGDGHLKKTSDGYMLFGQPVGLSDVQVYEYFKNPNNQKILLRLETALNEDPIPVPGKKGLIDLEDDIPQSPGPIAETPSAPEPEVPQAPVAEVPQTPEAPVEDNTPNMDEIMGGEDQEDVPEDDNLNDEE